MDYFTAYFVPQAWQNDYAIDVDAEGPQHWNCTAFVNCDHKYNMRACAKFKEREYDEEVLDKDDVLKADDDAPKWVQDWDGPFSIYVTRHASEAEMLLELARHGDREAAVKLQGMYCEMSHGPRCSYRNNGECDCIKSQVAEVCERFGLEVG